MRREGHTIPYFDLLFEKFRQGDVDFIGAFGQHVHWGYWGDPASAVDPMADFADAAERLTQRVCDAADIRDGMRVLDAGCGFGGTVTSLNRRFRKLKLVGLNIEGRQLDWARQRVQPYGENAIGFIEANACCLPFADNSFDVVLAVECIFHFPSRTQFFREARRVLRPGGQLALSDFVARGAGLPVLALVFASFRSSFLRFYGTRKLPCTFARYRTLAQCAGLSPLRSNDITLNTLPTYVILRRLLGKSEGYAADGARVTRLMEWTSRAGLLRYAILSCGRKASG